jgi:hypothetical protein
MNAKTRINNGQLDKERVSQAVHPLHHFIQPRNITIVNDAGHTEMFAKRTQPPAGDHLGKH